MPLRFSGGEEGVGLVVLLLFVLPVLAVFAVIAIVAHHRADDLMVVILIIIDLVQGCVLSLRGGSYSLRPLRGRRARRRLSEAPETAGGSAGSRFCCAATSGVDRSLPASPSVAAGEASTGLSVLIATALLSSTEEPRPASEGQSGSRYQQRDSAEHDHDALGAR